MHHPSYLFLELLQSLSCPSKVALCTEYYYDDCYPSFTSCSGSRAPGREGGGGFEDQ